jgi:hypothetical protein
MSFDESDYGREEFESQVAERALDEEGVQYALTNHFDEVANAVDQYNAEQWLTVSHDWLQLINIIARHDREQVRSAIRRRAYGGKAIVSTSSDLQVFNLASEISKLLEGVGSSAVTKDSQDDGQVGLLDNMRYGYKPGKAVSSLALYVQKCTVDEDMTWVSDLLALTRAFRDILFAVGDPQKQSSLHWELSDRIKAFDSVLSRGTRAKLIYRGFDGKRHCFDREPNVAATPLSSALAEWMCEYLVTYSERIDLGACVECGKIFSRQRSDNAYCSKTCQNRVAYKRRKIFEGGLLKKIEVTLPTAADSLQPGAWAYHPRLGLGLVETVTGKYRSISSVSVLFPQITRAFDARELFVTSAPKIEFYSETDPESLAELM